MSPLLSRRDLFLGAAGAAAAASLGACGDDGGPAAAPGGDTLRYQPIASFPRNEPYAAAGTPQRLPFLIAGPDGAPLDRIEGAVTFEVLRDGRRVGTPTKVSPHSEGLSRAYLPFETTFEEVGIHEIRGRYRGSVLETAIDVADPADVHIPQVGTPLLPVDTPTVDDHRGVEPICTNDPPCPFHATNLADSLAAGRPVLVLLSTPRYCVTAICGPVLDLLMAEVDGGGADGIDVIHAEVYADPDAVATLAEASQAPLVQAYSMVFEPCLFVADATGTLVRRLDTIYDRAELRDAIDAIS